MLRILRRVLLLAAVLLFIPFALTNRGRVEVGYWPFETAVEMPLFLLLIVTCALGAVLGWLLRRHDAPPAPPADGADSR